MFGVRRSSCISQNCSGTEHAPLLNWGETLPCEPLWRPSQSKGEEENANAGIFPAVPHTQAFWETLEGTVCWVGLDWTAATVPPGWGFCKTPTSSGDHAVLLLSEIIYFPQLGFFPHQSKPVFFSLAMNTN